MGKESTKMTVIAVIVITIIVIAVMLLVNTNKLQKSTTPTRHIIETSGMNSGYITIEDSYMISDLDLSDKVNLVAISTDDSGFKNIKFPSSTTIPAEIQLTDITLEEHITSIPDNLWFLRFYPRNSSSKTMEWRTIWQQLKDSPNLVGLEISDIFDGTDLIDVGDVIFKSNINPKLQANNANFNSFVLYDVQNISSLGKISLAPNFGFEASNEQELAVYQCQNITSIGDITIRTTTPITYTDINIEDNSLLESVGDIIIGAGFALRINSNDVLTSIGSLIFDVFPFDAYYIAISNNPLLPASVLSQIILDVDASGYSGGYLTLTDNLGSSYPALTLPAQAAYNNLIAKSWSVDL